MASWPDSLPPTEGSLESTQKGTCQAPVCECGWGGGVIYKQRVQDYLIKTNDVVCWKSSSAATKCFVLCQPFQRSSITALPLNPCVPTITSYWGTSRVSHYFRRPFQMPPNRVSDPPLSAPFSAEEQWSKHESLDRVLKLWEAKVSISEGETFQYYEDNSGLIASALCFATWLRKS